VWRPRFPESRRTATSRSGLIRSRPLRRKPELLVAMPYQSLPFLRGPSVQVWRSWARGWRAGPVGSARVAMGQASGWNQEQAWGTGAWGLEAAPEPGQRARATAARAVRAPEREQEKAPARARVRVLAQGHSPECRLSAGRGAQRRPVLAGLLDLRPRA